jgi:hypothetical protein
MLSPFREVPWTTSEVSGTSEICHKQKVLFCLAITTRVSYSTHMMKVTIFFWARVERIKYDLMAAFRNQKENAYFLCLHCKQSKWQMEILPFVSHSLTYCPTTLMNPELWILPSLWGMLRARNLQKEKKGIFWE